MAARIEALSDSDNQPAPREAPGAQGSEQPKQQYQSAAALAAKYPDEIELVKVV
jgi:hypothetical protein